MSGALPIDPADSDPVVTSLPIRFTKTQGLRLATLQHHKPLSALRNIPKEAQTKLDGNLVQLIYPPERLPPDATADDVEKYQNVMEAKMSLSANQPHAAQARTAYLGHFTPTHLNLLPLTGGEAHLELTLRWLDLELEEKKKALAKEAEADAPPAEIKGVLLSARKEMGLTPLQHVFNEKRNQNWRRLKVLGSNTDETIEVLGKLVGTQVKVEKGKEVAGLDDVDVDWDEGAVEPVTQEEDDEMKDY